VIVNDSFAAERLKVLVARVDRLARPELLGGGCGVSARFARKRTVGLNLSQSLGFEATQRVAHGRPTNAGLFGERRLGQLLTELEAVLDD
jgi:hypothetical protein